MPQTLESGVVDLRAQAALEQGYLQEAQGPQAAAAAAAAAVLLRAACDYYDYCSLLFCLLLVLSFLSYD